MSKQLIQPGHSHLQKVDKKGICNSPVILMACNCAPEFQAHNRSDVRARRMQEFEQNFKIIRKEE